MKITPQQTEKLLKGDYKFSQLGLSMLVTRLKAVYSRNESALNDATNEINAFLNKFNSIMENDYTSISKL